MPNPPRDKNFRRGKDRYNKRRAAAMKKVTAKGAYKPKVKAQMIKRRAPLVETKQRDTATVALINNHPVLKKDVNASPDAVQPFYTMGDPDQPMNWRLIPNDDGFTNIPLRSFLRNKRGLQDYQMIGDSITSKWLNLRVEVRFPQGELIHRDPTNASETSRNMMIQENYKLYMICGWITAPVNAPINDDSLDRIVRSKMTQADLNTHIKTQIQPYFNDNIDPLSFIPKSTANIKIDKYIRLKPNLANAIPTQADPITMLNGTSPTSLSTGSIPNVLRSHSWKVNRKIRYSYGQQPDPDPSKPELENNYPNESWLPFCIIYAPDFASLAQQDFGTTNPVNRDTWSSTDRQCSHVMLRWNDQHNYTDS